MTLLPAESRLYEAPVALDGGSNGLAVLRRIAVAALSWLAPGGHLVVEIGARQVDELRAVLTEVGLVAAVVRDEELGATVMTARRPTGMAGRRREN